MAHSCIAETCAGRFSGMPVSMRLNSAHEDEVLVVICRMSLSSKVASSGNLEREDESRREARSQRGQRCRQGRCALSRAGRPAGRGRRGGRRVRARPPRRRHSALYMSRFLQTLAVRLHLCALLSASCVCVFIRCQGWLRLRHGAFGGAQNHAYISNMRQSLVSQVDT